MSGRGDRRTEQSQLGVELASPTRLCCGALKQPSAKPRDADVSLRRGTRLTWAPLPPGPRVQVAAASGASKDSPWSQGSA